MIRIESFACEMHVCPCVIFFLLFFSLLFFVVLFTGIIYMAFEHNKFLSSPSSLQPKWSHSYYLSKP